MQHITKVEVLDILRRVLNSMLPEVGEENVTRHDVVDALEVVEQIDAIEKEIEPCPNPTSGDWRLTPMGHTPTSETSGATTSTAATSETRTPKTDLASSSLAIPSTGIGADAAPSAPPDLAAIRQAVERLRVAFTTGAMDRGYHPAALHNAAYHLLALDIPGVVERLRTLAKVTEEDRARLAIAYSEAFGRSVDWHSRAEAAEACLEAERAHLRGFKQGATEGAERMRQEIADWRRIAEKAEQERDDARKELDALKAVCMGREMSASDWEKVQVEIQEARDKALEDACGVAWPFASAIRAMKGKP